MDFDLNEDQALLVETLGKWTQNHMEIPQGSAASYLPGETLADELARDGFFEVARQEELGALGAVLLIEAAGRTPFAVETGASALVAPMLGLSDLPRPLALMTAENPIARFLSPNGAALVDAGDQVRLLHCEGRVEPVENLYAYPFGKFLDDPINRSRLLRIPVEAFRRWRALASAAEAVAASEAALQLTINYVRDRVQFKRPIGSFQTVQHRLAECTALVQGARLLVYRAAMQGGDALGYAVDFTHELTRRAILETTQFHGAIGQTLEYPLHLWTYRLRVLQYELYGAMDETRPLGGGDS